MPKKFLLSIDEKLHKKLKMVSSKQKQTMNTLINQYIQEGVQSVRASN